MSPAEIKIYDDRHNFSVLRKLALGHAQSFKSMDFSRFADHPWDWPHSFSWSSSYVTLPDIAFSRDLRDVTCDQTGAFWGRRTWTLRSMAHRKCPARVRQRESWSTRPTRWVAKQWRPAQELSTNDLFI